MVSKYDNEIRLEFVSKSCNEAFARIAVAAFASQLDPTVEEIADIKTAVSEAVTNAIVHAYPQKIGMSPTSQYMPFSISPEMKSSGIERIPK